MRHQFIGGPYAGRVLLVLSDEDKRGIPWEQYERRVEAISADGVLDLIVWDYRDSVTPPEQVAAVIDPTVAHAEYVPPLSPQDGGYSLIMGRVAEHVEAHMLDLDPTAATVEVEQLNLAPEPPLGPEPGDYGTMPGEHIWETFETRRKAIKLGRDHLGINLGGSKSLGWRLESGNVSKTDAKKLGLESEEAVYWAADTMLREYETGVRRV